MMPEILAVFGPNRYRQNWEASVGWGVKACTRGGATPPSAVWRALVAVVGYRLFNRPFWMMK